MLIFNIWFIYFLLLGQIQREVVEDQWDLIEKCWH